MTRFTSFVPSTTHFIWLSIFVFKICASSNTIEYAVWTSGVAKAPGAVNILPWSVFDVRKIQKRKDWSCLEVCRIHEEEKRSQIKTRNHEKAKIQSLRNEMQTYYCDVNSKMARIWNRPTTYFDLFSRFLVLGSCTGYPGTYRTANDLNRKRLLRRRNYSLRASYPVWVSEASLARTRERAAKPRGSPLARSRKAHFARPNRRACSQANATSFQIFWTAAFWGLFLGALTSLLLTWLDQSETES